MLVMTVDLVKHGLATIALKYTRRTNIPRRLCFVIETKVLNNNDLFFFLNSKISMRSEVRQGIQTRVLCDYFELCFELRWIF